MPHKSGRKSYPSKPQHRIMAGRKGMAAAKRKKAANIRLGRVNRAR